MVKNNVSDLELEEGINLLLSFYGNELDPYLIDYISNSWFYDRNRDYTSDIMLQFFDELGVADDSTNYYKKFLNLLGENFDYNCNVLEVGGGHFPRLSKRLAEKQVKGTVTVYDPKLLKVNYGLENLHLKKEEFTSSTSLDGVGLIIGCFPCQATDLIIERACQEKIDFQIALCDCVAGGDECASMREKVYLMREYVRRVGSKIEDSGLGQLNSVYLSSDMENLPIIYNKRI